MPQQKKRRERMSGATSETCQYGLENVALGTVRTDQNAAAVALTFVKPGGTAMQELILPIKSICDLRVRNPVYCIGPVLCVPRYCGNVTATDIQH